MNHITIQHSNPDVLKEEYKFKGIIPIVITPSNDYIPYFAVTVQSISCNADENYLYRIYVFHKKNFDIKRAMKAQTTITNNVCITFIDVSDFTKDFPFLIPQCFKDRFPVEVYFRLLVPTLLNEYNKVIYLDTDLIVLNDLRSLYNIDLGTNLIGGVSEFITPAQKQYVENILHIPVEKYINDGVLLMNCTELNKFDFMDKCLSILFKGTPQTVEQDLINIVCKDHIYYLDIKWNFRWHMGPYLLSEIERPYIFHYLSENKPWNTDSLFFSKYFSLYAALTDFF